MPPPAAPVYRVATIRGDGHEQAFSPERSERGSGGEVYDPPPWNTSFRNRFDDPRINDPNRGFPKEKCFRVLYFATERAGAYAEVLQRHIPNPEAVQEIFKSKPPPNPLLLGGQVKEAELLRRQVGTTLLAFNRSMGCSRRNSEV